MSNWLEETQISKDISQHEPTDEEKAKVEARTREEELQAKCKRFNAQNGNLDKNIYDCAICKNKGWIWQIEHIKQLLKNGETLEDDYLTCKECDCKKTRETIIRISESGLTKQMQKCTFENYKTENDWQKTIKDKALEIVNNKKSFYIGGFTGSGKTHICTAIVNELIKQGLSARYICWYDFMRELKSNLDKSEQKIAELQQSEVLYIDDLFKFTATEFEKNTLYQIIDYRQRNNLTTIISSECKFVNREEEAVKKTDIATIDLAIARRINLMAENGKYILSIPNNSKYMWRN